MTSSHASRARQRLGREGERAASAPIYPLDMEDGPRDEGRRFDEYAQDALDSLPSDLRAQMSNVEIVVEDEPPPGRAAARPLSGRTAHQTQQSLRRSAAGQDHDLPRPARASRRARPGEASPGGETGCPP